MKRYVVEEVGFGGSIQQVSLYENGGGTVIVKQFTDQDYEANRAAAIALCEQLKREAAQLIQQPYGSR